MIPEEYVNFETAKLLKVAGFPQEGGYDCLFDKEDVRYSIPKQSQAKRWLREERSLHIECDVFKRYGKPMYGWSVVSTRDDFLIGASDALPTYEAAVECAIKAACEFLTWKGGER